MTFSAARQVALARALNFNDVPPEWNLSTWFPFKAPSTLLATGWTFRYCPECLHIGYHTPLHQLPWIPSCPWHQRRLLQECVSCGRRAASGADWVLGRNLACECGHVPLDTCATLYALNAPPGAAQFVSEYRQWATEMRATTRLIAPDNGGDPRSALTALVQLPFGLRSPAAYPMRPAVSRIGGGRATPHVRTLATAKTAPPPDRDGLLALEPLRQDRPGFLTTPKRLVPSLTAVAARVALRLPPRTLTDGEMTLFLAGAGIEAPKGFAPAARAFSAEVSMLPPMRVGERRFLNLTCLHPSSYRAVTGLLDAVLDGRTCFDFYAQAQPAEFDLVMRACGALLSRGYAEGVRATLATHVPELYSLGRDAPRLTSPWVLLRSDSGAVTSVRIAWEALACAPRGEAALLVAADEANRRRQRVRRSSKRNGK